MTPRGVLPPAAAIKCTRGVAIPMQSGSLRAGGIVLLVGAIIQVLTALAVAVLVLLMGRVDMPPGIPAGLVQVAYAVLAGLLAIGAGVAFWAYADHRKGRVRPAWIKGLVASLLPPVQVVTLLGAVLCFASPEAQAARSPGAQD